MSSADEMVWKRADSDFKGLIARSLSSYNKTRLWLHIYSVHKTARNSRLV